MFQSKVAKVGSWGKAPQKAVLHKFLNRTTTNQMRPGEILGLSVLGSCHREEYLPWFKEARQRAIVTERQECITRGDQKKRKIVIVNTNKHTRNQVKNSKGN